MRSHWECDAARHLVVSSCIPETLNRKMNIKRTIAVAVPLMLFQTGCESPRALAPATPNRLLMCEDPSAIDCGGAPRPPSSPPAGLPPVIESPGFHLAADGVYEWDGNPPVGDLDPARLYLGSTTAEAPSGLNGVLPLGGSVYGYFYFDGDQSKIELIFSSSDASGNALRYNSKAGHDWQWCGGGPNLFLPVGRCTGDRDEVSEQLNLESYSCGASVVVGGTGWARKRWPFGITPSVRVMRVISIGAPKEWGEQSLPLPASRDVGPACPGSPGSVPVSGGGGEPPPPSGYIPPSSYGGGGGTICSYYWETTYVIDEGVVPSTKIIATLRVSCS